MPLGGSATDPATDINPPFLSVRVTAPFARSDGSTAVPGEPLVKKRFPLSRLARILHNSTASQNSSDPIYRDFGLYRSDPSQPWQYDHGDPNGIQRLAAITGQREPDFFELLKAAINVGSLGKGSMMRCDPNTEPTLSATNGTSASFFQQSGHDVQVNLQILQIGANIIDQYDSDNYSTRIAFAGNPSKVVCGVENLPYFYRIRLRAVQGTSTATPQMGMLFVNPEIWNPHAPSVASNTPTQFQVVAENTLGASSPTTYKITHYSPGVEDDKTINWGNGAPLTFMYDGPNGTLFREPTILTEQNAPAGSSLAGPSIVENTTGKTIVGIKATDFNWLDTTANKPPQNSYLGPDGPVTFSLQYLDGGKWVTYDQQMFQWSGSRNVALNSGTLWNIQLKSNLTWGGSCTDPRTSRWGATFTDYFFLIQPIDMANYIFPSQWASLSLPSYGSHIGTPGDSGFVNANNQSYPNNSANSPYEGVYRGFEQGYWSENTVRNSKGFFGVSDLPVYSRDPDGIARRATGGYTSDTANGGDYSSTTDGLPMITGNNEPAQSF